MTQRIGRTGRGSLGLLLQVLGLYKACLYRRISRVGAQKLLIKRYVRRAISRPGQRFAPAVFRSLAYVRMLRQLRQLRNTFTARGLAISEVLRQCERDLRVLRRLLRQPGQTPAGLIPAARSSAQRLVVLQG